MVYLNHNGSFRRDKILFSISSKLKVQNIIFINNQVIVLFILYTNRIKMFRLNWFNVKCFQNNNYKIDLNLQKNY